MGLAVTLSCDHCLRESPQERAVTLRLTLRRPGTGPPGRQTGVPRPAAGLAQALVLPSRILATYSFVQPA